MTRPISLIVPVMWISCSSATGQVDTPKPNSADSQGIIAPPNLCRRQQPVENHVEFSHRCKVPNRRVVAVECPWMIYPANIHKQTCNMHTYIYNCAQINVPIYIHITHIHTQKHTHIHIHTFYTCTYTHTHTHIHAHTFSHMFTRFFTHPWCHARSRAACNRNRRYSVSENAMSGNSATVLGNIHVSQSQKLCPSYESCVSPPGLSPYGQLLRTAARM